jgi:RecB family exonuclease
MGTEAMAVGNYEGREVRVGCRVLRPGDVDELLTQADRTPVTPEPEPPGLEALAAPVLAAVEVPRALPVSRLSYSGLEAYRRCGYRFYLERALRLPRPTDVVAAEGEGGEDGMLPAVVRGSLVHELLESLDFAAPAPPAAEQVVEVIEAAGQPVRDHEVEDMRGLIEDFASSPLAARIGAARRIRAELPFAFTLDTGEGRSLLIDGIVDVHATEADGTALVVDYKTDRLEGADPAERVAEAYTTQQLVYALAALRSGAKRVEVAYSFLERPGEPVAVVHTVKEVSELEERLRGLAAGVSAGRFEPTANPHRGLCADCPGRPALCSWDEEHTLSTETA